MNLKKWFRVVPNFWSVVCVCVSLPDTDMRETYIEHKNPETRKTRLLSSGTKPFITFELKVFQHKERGTIFL